MISIKTYASGSTGNLYHIDDGKTSLLIECGIPLREIRKALGFNISSVAGCLVSHGHGDHSASAEQLTKYGIDVYCTDGTADEIGLKNHRVRHIEHGEVFRLGSFKIMPFSVQHDAVEPVGFLMVSGSDAILYATDTYYIKYKFKNLTHIMIECNYSRDILEGNIEKGIVHPALKKRIERSHFELENVKNFLRANDLSKVREIHLIHISNQNGDPGRFQGEIQALTGITTYIPGGNKWS